MALLSMMTPNLTNHNLPLAREADWDFAANRPLWRGGEPVICTGARAVLVWAWCALHTQRGDHDVYTNQYGQDLRALTGRAYSPEVRQSEAIRCVRECLMINPYITDVTQIHVTLEGSKLHLWVTINTIYGEVSLNDVTV